MDKNSAHKNKAWIKAVADEFICHKEQVIKAIVNAHQMDDDDREFARRLMKALALLIEDLATSHNDDGHEASIGALSGMVLEGLNHGCQPDLDTVEVRINYRHSVHTLGLPFEAFRAGFFFARYPRAGRGQSKTLRYFEFFNYFVEVSRKVC